MREEKELLGQQKREANCERSFIQSVPGKRYENQKNKNKKQACFISTFFFFFPFRNCLKLLFSAERFVSF